MNLKTVNKNAVKRQQRRNQATAPVHGPMAPRKRDESIKKEMITKTSVGYRPAAENPPVIHEPVRTNPNAPTLIEVTQFLPSQANRKRKACL
jgi:hypothetical protein